MLFMVEMPDLGLNHSGRFWQNGVRSVNQRREFRHIESINGIHTAFSLEYLLGVLVSHQFFQSIRTRPRIVIENPDRIGALPELAEDGKTGFLADPSRPEDLAAALARAFDFPEATESMGQP